MIINERVVWVDFYAFGIKENLLLLLHALRVNIGEYNFKNDSIRIRNNIIDDMIHYEVKIYLNNENYNLCLDSVLKWFDEDLYFTMPNYHIGI